MRILFSIVNYLVGDFTEHFNVSKSKFEWTVVIYTNLSILIIYRNCQSIKYTMTSILNYFKNSSKDYILNTNISITENLHV